MPDLKAESNDSSQKIRKEPLKFIRNPSTDMAGSSKKPFYPVKETRTSLLRRNVILTKQLESVVHEINRVTDDTSYLPALNTHETIEEAPANITMPEIEESDPPNMPEMQLGLASRDGKRSQFIQKIQKQQITSNMSGFYPG